MARKFSQASRDQRTFSSVMRDANFYVNMHGIATPANLASGLFLPAPGENLRHDFYITQIIITGGFTYHWELDPAYDPINSRLGPEHMRLYGTFMEGILVSLPLTVRLKCPKDRQILIRADSTVGSPSGTGNSRFQLIGYYEPDR